MTVILDNNLVSKTSLEKRLLEEPDSEQIESYGFKDKPYMPLQLKEIEEHAYFLGVQYGREVSMNEACLDYVISHHADRFRKDYAKHRTQILDYCQNHCSKFSEDCGLNSSSKKSNCELSMKRIHELLEDWESPDTLACDIKIYDPSKKYKFKD